MTESTMRYIVGVDGSEPSRRAVEFAAEQAAASGAGLLIAHIIHWSSNTFMSAEEIVTRPLYKREEERIAQEEILAPILEAVHAKGVDVDSYYTWGAPAELLRELAQQRAATMIIVGRRGQSSLAELVLGSVSNKIAHISDIPVVLVP